MNTLREALDDYLSMRRSLGFKLHSDGKGLKDFVLFLENRKTPHITTQLALEWAQQQHSTRGYWAQRLCWIRGFATYRSATDPQTEVPPSGIWSFANRRARPYLYSESEIKQLLKAALSLKGRNPTKGLLYHSLLGLLVVTGMRVSEVINLKMKDVDLVSGVITIKGSKLGKCRLVPLHASTQQVLSKYKKRRDKFLKGCPSDYFFVSNSGTRLHSAAVRLVFDELRRKIGLDKTGLKNAPRLHDFRHRFAIQTLLRWYRKGEDIERKMPVLSTYLGHVDIACTFWYLSASPELMGLAIKRLDQRWEVS